MHPLEIVFATRNLHKCREIEAFFKSNGLKAVLRPCPEGPEIPETGGTFLDNAVLKALAIAALAPGAMVLAEDSGFVADALAGRDGLAEFPGVRSNRWLTPALRAELLGGSPEYSPVSDAERNRAMLLLLDGRDNREGRYVCEMVLYRSPDGLLFSARGEMPLQIVRAEAEMRGDKGFGYDPMVLPISGDGRPDARTVAELTQAEKNRISHRGRALAQVAAWLKSQISVI